MVYPNTGLPVKTFIAPGASPTDPTGWAWTDVSSSVRLRDKISITVGRGDGAAKVDPGKCNLRFDNRAGNFTPRNPLGVYYGTLGKNTPLRVSIRRVEDAFGRTVASGWGNEPLWDIAYTNHNGAAADRSVGSGVGSITPPSTNVDFACSIDTGSPDHWAQVTLPSITTPAGASVRYGLMIGMTSSIQDQYRCALVVTTAGAVTAEIAARVSGTYTTIASQSTGLSIASAIVAKAQIDGDRIRFKVWQASGSEPTTWTATATDTTVPTGTRVACFARRETSNTSPTVFTFDDFTADTDRFSGFVSEWPPRWTGDKSGRDASVPVEAHGVLHRLQQGKPPPRSPLRRAITAAAPAAYWPCEEGTESTLAGSAVAGHPALTVIGTVAFKEVTKYTFAGTTTKWGTGNLADLAAGGKLVATIPGDVTAACASAWMLHAMAATDPSGAAAEIVLMEWTTAPGGTYVRWQLIMDNSPLQYRIVGYDTGGSATTLLTSSGMSTTFTSYVVSARQSGGNIVVGLYTGDSLPDTTATVAATLTGPATVTANATSTTWGGELPFGHLAVFASDPQVMPYTCESIVDSYGGIVNEPRRSNRNEAAHNRLARLCTEDGVSLSAPAVAAEYVTRMGWQPTLTPLELYDSCVDADQGVLYESGFGLAFLPRQHRYNPAVALALDFDLGQIAEPPEPTDDDQQLRNRWKVDRTDGASAIAQDNTSIAAAGPYEDSLEVNLFDDGPIADVASWLVHVGVTDVMRWPRLDLDLAAAPELIGSWLACRVGSRVTAIHPPDQVAGDDIDVLVEGYTETLGFKDWDIGLNCSPAKPWQVGAWGSDNPDGTGTDRYEGSGSTLNGAHSNSTTSLSVATPAGSPLWTTDADDVPFDIVVGGERMTVTAISGGSSPQTMTVTRSVNGIVKAHSSGAAVLLFKQAVYAL